MANAYIEGLRIETPEGFTPLAGETFTEASLRLLSQCRIGSATSAENDSGPSAPTAENIGQLQNDVAAIDNRVKTLEGQQDTLTDLGERVTTLEKVKDVYGVLSGLTGTSGTVTLPNTGTWIVQATSINGFLINLWYSITTDTITFHWTAPIPTGAAIAYHAHNNA